MTELTEIENLELADLGNPDGDQNQQPPPVPEGQRYIVSLQLGKRGIETIKYPDKQTGAERSFVKMQVVGKFVGTETGDTDLAFFQQLADVRMTSGDGRERDITTFPLTGKPKSGILYLGQDILGLSLRDFSSVKEYIEAIGRALQAAKKPQAVTKRIQWQLWDGNAPVIRDNQQVMKKDGTPLTGRVVRYGAKNFPLGPDGKPSPYVKSEFSNDMLTARAVILDLLPLV